MKESSKNLNDCIEDIASLLEVQDAIQLKANSLSDKLSQNNT